MSGFQGFIDKERTRLTKEREDLTAKREEIDTQLTAIDRELSAIGAYEAVKTGKAPEPTLTPKAPRKVSDTSRAPRGSKKEELLKLIHDRKGATRAQIIEAMGIKGDKSAESSVSNALSTLSKAGTLANNGGVYSVVEVPVAG